MDKTKPRLIGTSLILYAVSFLLPTAGDMIGAGVFVIAVLQPFLWVAWLANPFYWLALAKIGADRWEAAANFALIAVMFGVGGLLPFGFPCFGPGYWFWIAAPAALLIGSVKLAKRADCRRNGPRYPVVPHCPKV